MKANQAADLSANSNWFKLPPCTYFSTYIFRWPETDHIDPMIKNCSPLKEFYFNIRSLVLLNNAICNKIRHRL